VAGAGEDGVDGIAGGSGKVIALQETVAFGVTDHRFDGIAPSELALDGGRSARAGVGDVDFRRRQAMAAIAAIDIGARDFAPGDALELGDLTFERMAVPRGLAFGQPEGRLRDFQASPSSRE
jgi:hypothetical protein